MPYLIDTRIVIHTLPSKAWAAVTDPALIQRYFSAVNGPVVFKWEEGKNWDEVAQKLLHTIDVSEGGRQEQIHFNEYHLTYHLEVLGDEVTIRIIHDNIDTESRQLQIKSAWEKLLAAIKLELEQQQTSAGI